MELDERTTRSAIGSPTPSSAAGRPPPARSSMPAPIERRMSMTARRVGLTPTSRIVSSASGWMAPATSQKAAAETSPGPVPRSPAPPPLLRPSRRTAHPAPSPARPGRPAPEHPLRVVARRDRLANRRPALRPEPRQEDRRLHLCPRHRRRVVDRPERGVPDHGERREGVVAARLEHRAHRAQRFDDTSHRTATQ